MNQLPTIKTESRATRELLLRLADYDEKASFAPLFAVADKFLKAEAKPAKRSDTVSV